MKLVVATITIKTPVPDRLSDQVLEHIRDQTIKALEHSESSVENAIAIQLGNYAEYVEIDFSY